MKGSPCTPENAHSIRYSHWPRKSILSARLYLHMRISAQSPHHTSNHEPSRSHYIGDIQDQTSPSHSDSSPEVNNSTRPRGLMPVMGECNESHRLGLQQGPIKTPASPPDAVTAVRIGRTPLSFTIHATLSALWYALLCLRTDAGGEITWLHYSLD